MSAVYLVLEQDALNPYLLVSDMYRKLMTVSRVGYE